MAALKGRKGSNAARPIIIRREEIIEDGRHGGAWKIAYADFMTAMMAFFLVMWLINATTEQQRRGIAAFFNPFAERDDPAQDSNLSPTQPSQTALQKPFIVSSTASRHDDILGKAQQARSVRFDISQQKEVPQEAKHEPSKVEEEAFRHAPEKVRAALAHQPSASQVNIGGSSNELCISIADTEHQPMFELGTAVPNEHAIALLRALVPVLQSMPGMLSIDGFTDAMPYQPGKKTNWLLSALRAEAARSVLVQAGLPEWRFQSVAGRADHDLADPEHPRAALNRRVVLTLTRRTPPIPSEKIP
ncbi:flagellar motor protein MotB [Kozakia baliensis]|uniref:flagellar motor protein MotB n=1 Tax=Kozakia baliensis TaxID=153496 RepID=UPI00345BE522